MLSVAVLGVVLFCSCLLFPGCLCHWLGLVVLLCFLLVRMSSFSLARVSSGMVFDFFSFFFFKPPLPVSPRSAMTFFALFVFPFSAPSSGGGFSCSALFFEVFFFFYRRNPMGDVFSSLTFGCWILPFVPRFLIFGADWTDLFGCFPPAVFFGPLHVMADDPFLISSCLKWGAAVPLSFL